MNELFRTNLFLADSDSVNNLYNEEEYIKKFKSAVLMAKSIGLNPNMIIDSNGFENIVSNPSIKNYFINKIIDSDKEGLDYSIKVHIFGDFISDDYFNDYSTENPFIDYYNTKVKDDYLFSSLKCTKKELNSNTLLKNQYFKRLNSINNFKKEIYTKTGKNIFDVNKSPLKDLRQTIIDRLDYIIKNINSNSEYVENMKKEYFSLLLTFNDLVKNDKTIVNRSHFYTLLNHNQLSGFNSVMIHSLKTDIIDITYNSSFIKKDEIFRFKSLSTIDNIYSKIFDSYANDGMIIKTYKLYNEFNKIKSKFEIIDLALSMNPFKIINYLADELMNKVEDKKISSMHKIASYIIPKTRLLGISDSKNLLIGVKS